MISRQKAIFAAAIALLCILSACAGGTAPGGQQTTAAPVGTTQVTTTAVDTTEAATTEATTTEAAVTTMPDTAATTTVPAQTTSGESVNQPQTTMPATTPPTAPPPVDTTGEAPQGQAMSCTIIIRCDNALASQKLDAEIAAILPADGVILTVENAVVNQGESAFVLLQREARQNKIHLEFTKTPAYNSAYIEGIGNLYEMDCGELSGWVYKVNGAWPGYGCSRYALQDGDVIEWLYTCDLGKDVGAEGAGLGGGE